MMVMMLYIQHFISFPMSVLLAARSGARQRLKTLLFHDFIKFVLTPSFIFKSISNGEACVKEICTYSLTHFYFIRNLKWNPRSNSFISTSLHIKCVYLGYSRSSRSIHVTGCPDGAWWIAIPLWSETKDQIECWTSGITIAQMKNKQCSLGYVIHILSVRPSIHPSIDISIHSCTYHALLCSQVRSKGCTIMDIERFETDSRCVSSRLQCRQSTNCLWFKLNPLQKICWQVHLDLSQWVWVA